MKYSVSEVMQYVQEEDVKFIRLAFCDIFGKQKNIAIMPYELRRAFTYGIPIDASSIPGFGGELHQDLFLKPDPATLSRLPWRPESGSVVRMYCDISHPDGTPFEYDCRRLLKETADAAAEKGTASVSVQNSSFISSASTNRENPHGSRMTMQDIWISLRMTGERMSVVKSS